MASDGINSVEEEKRRVMEDEENGVAVKGIRMVGIEKIYRRLPFGIKSVNDVHAVKGVTLEISKNELFCLLGHNGAGKSTLFNIMTGLIDPTFGHAIIAGYDIRYH